VTDGHYIATRLQRRQAQRTIVGISDNAGLATIGQAKATQSVPSYFHELHTP
jgi:hypothetical protein